MAKNRVSNLSRKVRSDEFEVRPFPTCQTAEVADGPKSGHVKWTPARSEYFGNRDVVCSSILSLKPSILATVICKFPRSILCIEIDTLLKVSSALPHMMNRHPILSRTRYLNTPIASDPCANLDMADFIDDEAIMSFISVTHADPEQAKSYLQVDIY